MKLNFWLKKKIFRISLNKLDYNSGVMLDKKLNNISEKKCEALFIDISAAKGKLTECEDFVTQIQHFKNKNKSIPIYTFGNEAIFGPTLLILLSGDYAFIDKNTMLGLFDFYSKRNVYYKFLNEKKYEFKFITAGKHKIRLDPFKEIKSEDIQWAKNLLNKEKEFFVDKVKELRGDKLKINHEELENRLNSKFMIGNDAFDIGLIDGFNSLDAFRMEKFKSIKIKDATISSLDLIQSLKKCQISDVTASEDLNIMEMVSQAECELMSYVFDNTLKFDIRI